MPEGTQVRGLHQYRAQVRRNGVYQTKTLESLRGAQEWRRIVEGKVTGDEFVDLKGARTTTLAQACDWMLDGKFYGSLMPRTLLPNSVIGGRASSRIGRCSRCTIGISSSGVGRSSMKTMPRMERDVDPTPSAGHRPSFIG